MSAATATKPRQGDRRRLLENVRWFIAHAATERRLGRMGPAAAALKQAAAARERVGQFRE